MNPYTKQVKGSAPLNIPIMKKTLAVTTDIAAMYFTNNDTSLYKVVSAAAVEVVACAIVPIYVLSPVLTYFFLWYQEKKFKCKRYWNTQCTSFYYKAPIEYDIFAL